MASLRGSGQSDSRRCCHSYSGISAVYCSHHYDSNYVRSLCVHHLSKQPLSKPRCIRQPCCSHQAENWPPAASSSHSMRVRQPTEACCSIELWTSYRVVCTNRCGWHGRSTPQGLSCSSQFEWRAPLCTKVTTWPHKDSIRLDVDRKFSSVPNWFVAVLSVPGHSARTVHWST